jgi:hypothetical protein
MIYFLTILFAVYFIYTLSFAIKFNRTNTVFSDNQRLLHNFLIWIIPFIWIMIIKTMTIPTPGSGKFKKAKPSGFYESGIGIFGHDDGHHHGDGGHGDDGSD